MDLDNLYLIPCTRGLRGSRGGAGVGVGKDLELVRRGVVKVLM